MIVVKMLNHNFITNIWDYRKTLKECIYISNKFYTIITKNCHKYDHITQIRSKIYLIQIHFSKISDRGFQCPNTHPKLKAKASNQTKTYPFSKNYVQGIKTRTVWHDRYFSLFHPFDWNIVLYVTQEWLKQVFYLLLSQGF